MWINQGIDLFDFFKIICTHVITDADAADCLILFY